MPGSLNKNKFYLSYLILYSLFLDGCSWQSAATGTAATIGIMATQERGFGDTVTDNTMWLALNKKLLSYSNFIFLHVDSIVYEGRVLLTGYVKNPHHRLLAVKLAWQTQGVQEVINEIIITKKSDLLDYAHDAWIIGQLKSKILIDQKIRAINYAIEAAGGIVYFLGIAQDHDELQQIINHARDIPYVKKVVSYVRIKEL
ncbi:MAG: BON domain-containing protein [Alphaproteobacteria bacterium]|nr:BON domain-containing protein [Alphaproteobacteria bacterium]